MGLLDQIKDILLNGPDDWRSRLRETVELTSPEGNSFSAKWQSGPRSIEKKLGIFLYPKVKGNIVQDLDINSARYTINLFFEGSDHDKTAADFFRACGERGTWTVIHPVHGFVDLQLVSAKEVNDPIRSANITEFQTDWIESIDPLTLKTKAELIAEIEEKVKDLNVSAAQQFADNLNQNANEFSRAVQSATEKAVLISDVATKPLFDSIDALDTTITAIQSAINDTITQTTILTDGLAGQLQQLTQLPALGNGDARSKFNAFDDLVDSAADILPATVTKPQIAKNEASVAELSMVSAIGSIAISAVQSTLGTRVEAVSLAEFATDFLDKVTETLDNSQADFQDTDFVDQYFSQTQSFDQAVNLIATVNTYLRTVAPSLRVEKRFTIDRPRSPIEITITEYGDLGDNDSNFDLFIDTNGLKGDQILLLDRNTEVVIYA